MNIKGRRVGKSGSVKRAISLPRTMDSTLADIAASEHLTYSSVVQDAVRLYVARRSASQREEQYRDYYGGAKAAIEDKELASDLSRLSGDQWP